MFYVSLGIILFIFLASLLFQGRFFWEKFSKLYFYFSLPAVFVFLSVFSLARFFEWKQDSVSKYLIPPYQSADYFFFYCFSRYFDGYLISAIGAFVFLVLAKFLNKKYGERFFYPEEPYLGALSVFILGFPGFLSYAVFLAAIFLLGHICLLFPFRGFEKRISLRRLWLPAAIFAIIMNNFVIQNLPVWQALKI